MASPSEAANQEILARSSRRIEVTTYRLVKADKPDLRQVRDCEGNLWFMQEQCVSDGTRTGGRHRLANDDKATALRGSQERTREKGRHTMSRRGKPQKHSTSTRRSSPADAKEGQGDQHLPVLEDTEFEARSCTTPRDAEWAQRAIHATSKTKQSAQQSLSKAEHSSSKNEDYERTKSSTVSKKGEPKREVATKGSEDTSRRDSHTLPDPITHSEDAVGDINSRRGSVTSRVASRSQHPEAKSRGSQDGTGRCWAALSTSACSEFREVLIEDGNDGDSSGSTTPRVVGSCFPTVKPLDQHHLSETSNDLEVDAEETSKLSLQVEQPLTRNNVTRHSSRQCPSESLLRHVTDSETRNISHTLQSKSPIPDIDDLRTISSENESDELLASLPAVGKEFEWSSMRFAEDRSPPNIRVADWYEHNRNKPLPDTPKDCGSPRILLKRRLVESSKIGNGSNHTRIGSRFFETELR